MTTEMASKREQRWGRARQQAGIMLPLCLVFTAAISLIVYSSIDVAMQARRQAINLERRSEALAAAESAAHALAPILFAELTGDVTEAYQLQLGGLPDLLTLECRAHQLPPGTSNDNNQVVPFTSGEIHFCCVPGEACEQGAYHYVQRLLSR